MMKSTTLCSSIIQQILSTELCGKFGAAQVHRDMPEKVFGETETVELERALEVARMGTALLGVKKGSSE